tara:strand:+ start:141 stop:485 length:345 start_codon:yes stop_codon:yes gene_type:complete
MITNQDLHLMFIGVCIEQKEDPLCDGFCLYFKNPETVLKGVTSLCLGCKEKRILVAFRNIRTKVFFDSWKEAVHKKRPISPNSIAKFSNIFIKKKRKKTIEKKRKGVRKRRRRR